MSAEVTLIHLSAGWKRYLCGAFNRSSKGNFYGYGGLGLMMGKVKNATNIIYDTANYKYPVNNGDGKFKRLTIDVGLGYERALGGDIFVYVESRSHIPITNYPTPYLLVNGYAPLNIAALIGIRILWD